MRGEKIEMMRTFAVVLAGACAFLGLYATQPLLPLLEQIFHASKVAVSLTVTGSTLGVAFAAPSIGALADRLGRRRVIVTSGWLLALTTLLAATATNLTALIFWRVLQGLVTPGVFAVTVAYINDEWREAGAGAAMAAYVTGTVLGGFTGRLVAGFAASAWNWHASFIAIGLLCALGALAMQVWLPAEKTKTEKASANTRAAALSHLRNPKLGATYAAGFCVLFTLVATFTYVSFHLADPPYQLKAAGLGAVFFVYLIGAFTTSAAGRWIDRFGQRTMLACAVALGICGILLTLAPPMWVIIAGLALCCTGVFISQAAATTFIGTAAEHDRALAVGLYVMFYYVGGSAGAALPGFLWPFGGWTACVFLIAAVQLTTLMLALTFWSAPERMEAPLTIVG